MGGIKDIVTARTGSGNYNIIIGKGVLLSGDLQDMLKNHDRVLIIASDTVYGFHRVNIDALVGLVPGGDLVLLDDSEEKKNYGHAEKYLNVMLDRNLSRKSALVAIGGGVTGDFGGFIAGLYMRGINVFHVPTTLLAMVDSSLGGKTAVNLSAGKNIAGVFHQPSMVVTDTEFLKTLPAHEFINGLAESFKHGLIGDSETRDIFFDNDLESIGNDETVKRLIYRSVVFKTSVVERDEKEGGLRAILNFGHTIGHAIESLMEYRGISHGSAVAFGMMVKLRISRELGWINTDEYQKIEDVFSRYDLCAARLSLNVDDILRHMKYDKKSSFGRINFVMVKGPGTPVYNQDIEVSLLEKAIEESLRRP